MPDAVARARTGFPCAVVGQATREHRKLIARAYSCPGSDQYLAAELAELKSLWKNGLTPYY